MAKQFDKTKLLTTAVEQQRRSQEYIKTQLQLLPTLQELIPPLSEEELTQLEENIAAEGCREPLIVWQRGNDDYVLVDGHNRFAICRRLGLEFQVQVTPFDGLEAVTDWMIRNQLGRRNLTPEQQSYLRGLRYRREKNERGNPDRFSAKPQNGDMQRTSEKMAKEFNVSKNTIERDGAYAAGLDVVGALHPELKQSILSGAVKVKKTCVQHFAEFSPEVLESYRDLRVAELYLQAKAAPVKPKRKPHNSRRQTLEFRKTLHLMVDEAMNTGTAEDFQALLRYTKKVQREWTPID